MMFMTIISFFFSLFFLCNNIFAGGREYGDMYYEISLPGSEYDTYDAIWSDRLIIDKNGNKIFDMLLNEHMEILKDLYTNEPKLLLKYSFDRKLVKYKDAKKYVKNYNPIYSYAHENLVEKHAPYWWYHIELNEENGHNMILGTKVKAYDLKGNDLNIEFEIENDKAGSDDLLNSIWTFDNMVFYVKGNSFNEEMYYYNLNTKEKKKLGYYAKMNILPDKIVLYKTDHNENIHSRNKFFHDKSSVGFFTKNMSLIKEFSGYEKVEYVKIANKDYYVLTYNKLVSNRFNENSLRDYNANTGYIRYANFVDENFNLVFGKDIFIDYEDIMYDFDYEKVFNENMSKNNTIRGPHNKLIDTNIINLIIELKDEMLYMICDEKGYAICDENRNILGQYFDKPIYIHNIADTRDRLIFSYEVDDVSHFVNYYRQDYDDLELYYDSVGTDSFKEKIENSDYRIIDANLTRQYFYINGNKVQYLENVEDMVLVVLNMDGFYFYHKVYGNNGITYLRKNRNDLSKYENEIYDLAGNTYNVKGLEYLTKIYKINNKYYLFPSDGRAYQYNHETQLFDFNGNEVLDMGDYMMLDDKLIQKVESGKISAIYFFDDEFKKSKEINIDNYCLSSKYHYLILYNSKANEKTVYDKNFNLVEDVNSLPYNFLNLKQTVNPHKMDISNKIITGTDIESKNDNYNIIKAGNGKYDLWDKDAKEKVLSNYKYLDYYSDKYLLYEYGFKFGLMDYKGNKFCEFSIFDINGSIGDE